ncbi:hypothetical protein [Amycolatopsis sp. 195334CR]|uniref:hypothetical protein n=1 Tax=Amycolatopsis sp. 195334CR TaxID=2814588 RepID=UPI001A8E6D85|nr:hypothetical protein [Amycolatopsis sp. 195334CR]MBN6040443.1 hypothetical protein [Amycolatopsis sp. 195334CR]
MSAHPARVAGMLIAGTGLAHFAAPRLFEAITAPLFPKDTRGWVYRNGATELALGVALSADKTRKAGIAGLAAYVVWLASRAAANR